MTKFYTQTGDDGYTGLLGEGRTPKYDPRIDTIGTIDEANAAIGLARSMCVNPRTDEILLHVQRDLYHIMTEVAVLPENASKFQRLTSERVTWLEDQIDGITDVVNIPHEFIIPGDTKSSAAVDMARAIVRRAERKVAQIYHQGNLDNHEIVRYINRLSSLCFALELLENQAGGHTEPTLARE